MTLLFLLMSSAYVSVHMQVIAVTVETTERHQFPWSWSVSQLLTSQCRCWELNSALLKEEHVLLTAPLPQPHLKNDKGRY